MNKCFAEPSKAKLHHKDSLQKEIFICFLLSIASRIHTEQTSMSTPVSKSVWKGKFRGAPKIKKDEKKPKKRTGLSKRGGKRRGTHMAHAIF